MPSDRRGISKKPSFLRIIGATSDEVRFQDPSTVDPIGSYRLGVFSDRLQLQRAQSADWASSRSILLYGPGDLVGLILSAGYEAGSPTNQATRVDAAVGGSYLLLEGATYQTKGAWLYDVAGDYLSLVEGITGLTAKVNFITGYPTQTTVGAAGAASALPANPTGYIRIQVAGAERVIPFYAQA